MLFGNINVLYILVIIVVILLSMTLHEAMHAFVGYWLGDDTAKLQGRLTLNPIKHIDPFLTLILPITLAIIGAPVFGGAKPVPFNPSRVKFGEWGAALVALAGPLTNLVIAFVFFGVGVLTLPVLPQGNLLGEFITTTIMVNLGFFVFNSIPIPPLDGSRVLYALAPEFVRRAMEVIEQFGVMFIFLIVLVANGVIGSFMLAMINVILKAFDTIFHLF